MVGRIASIFCCPRTVPWLSSEGLWRIPFAHECAYVVLELTETNKTRMGVLDGIGVFAGPGEMGTTGLRESTWHGLNSET